MLRPALSSVVCFACAMVGVASEDSCITVNPPMGWNGYDSTSHDAGQNETVVLDTASFVAEHLKDVGYEYIVLDAGWFGGIVPGPHTLDGYGRLIPNVTLHPSSEGGAGLRPLADQIHSMGLKFGFWIMGGIPREAVEQKLPVMGTNFTADEIADLSDVRRCPWAKDFVYGSKVDNEGRVHPGVSAYYDSVAGLYASWDTDLLKMDCVFGVNWERGHQDIDQLVQSMAKLNHSYTLSLSPGSNTALQRNLSLPLARNLSQHYNLTVMARMSPDFWDKWEELFAHFQMAAEAAPLTEPGFYPDLDMLPLGWLAHVGGPHFSHFSAAESRSLMTQWVMARAPLMWGGAADDVRANATTLGLIGNGAVNEVLRRSCGNRQLHREGNVTVWAAATADRGKKYVALLNLGEEAADASANLMSPEMPGAPFASGGAYSLQDLWQSHKTVWLHDVLTVHLEPRSSMLFLVEEMAPTV